MRDGLTFYIQETSPGGSEEANWLPAPAGTFYMVLRLFLPGEDVLTGDWQPRNGSFQIDLFPVEYVLCLKVRRVKTGVAR